MSHFYGVVTGQAKTQATRRGSGTSGLTTQAAGMDGQVEVSLYVNDAGENSAEIHLKEWGYGRSGGPDVLIYQGPIGPVARRTLKQAGTIRIP